VREKTKTNKNGVGTAPKVRTLYMTNTKVRSETNVVGKNTKQEK